ncbi:MAG TPA: polysaccharide deacetylase family sporulation protein PdaB [Bacillales bacterium]
MKFFWIVNGQKLKKTLLIVVSAFVAAAIAFMNSEELPVFSTSSGPRAISKVDTEKKQVALTFDIGWGDIRAKPILKVLEKKEVQATFFVSGSWTEHHPKIAKKIVTQKNEIASHGFGHKNYRSMEEADIRKDILLAREAIKKATGQKTSLLRPPNGSFNEKILKIAESLGYTVIDSSVNSRDITNPGAKKIVRNVVEPASPGDIILMHASDSTKQTGKALPAIIEKLKDEGFSFVTVSKLLSNAETKSELVK